MSDQMLELNYSLGNWQDLVLETATYGRPVDFHTLKRLSDNMAFEGGIETINLFSTGAEEAVSSVGVFHPEQEDPSSELKLAVADEFGDMLWYQIAILAEFDVSPQEIVARAIQKINPDIETYEVTLGVFNDIAGSHVPTFTQSWAGLDGKLEYDLDDNPYVLFAARSLAPFVRAFHPEHAEPQLFTDEYIDLGADLLWAVTYLLNNYCDISLGEVLDRNYYKIRGRQLNGITLGRGFGENRLE